MANGNSSNSKTRAIVIAVFLVILLVPLAYGVVGWAVSLGGDNAQPFLEKPEGQECVRSAEFMRYHHFLLLKQVRDEVMRHGKKEEISLQGCAKCHTSRENFCDRCHSIANVYPDCYGCHHYPK